MSKPFPQTSQECLSELFRFFEQEPHHIVSNASDCPQCRCVHAINRIRDVLHELKRQQAQSFPQLSKVQELINEHGDPGPEWMVPWEQKTDDNRLPPRECVKNARDALDRTYGMVGPAPYPLLIEAVDWLRRALEQMVPKKLP